MRNRIGTQGVVWLLACAALLTVAGTTFVQSRQSKQTAFTGRFTKTQILAQSEPLLQALLVGSATVDTIICPITTFDSAGQPVHHWNIDCTDPKTGDRAHLLWNADSGELVRATQVRQQETVGKSNASSDQKVPTGLAWDWFHAMKISHATEEWHIVGTRKKPYAYWDFCFRSGDHYTILTVKSTTGQLVMATCGHLPRANMAWSPFKNSIVS